MSFVNPAPGATQGRVDQGVDWSNVRSIVAVAAGKIVNVFNLPGFGQTIIERLRGGQEVYYAEETAGGTATVTPGQTVTAGQQVATGRGGAIEVGYWNPATGHASGWVPGRTSGASTPAGRQFLQAIGQSSSLASLWVQAGGNPGLANLMAAIAMAESGGNPGATHKNTDGSIDRGLWQINSVHTQYDPNRLLTDPLYNAQAAVAIERTPPYLANWSTYTSGAYKQFLGKPDLVRGGWAGRAARTRPGGESVGVTPPSQVPKIFDSYTRIRDMPRTAPPNTKNPFAWFMASFTGNWEDLVTPPGAAAATPGRTVTVTPPSASGTTRAHQQG